MAKREYVEEETTRLITPFCDELGFELVDVDFEKEGQDYYLRVYIDKPGGITIDDCETLSRAYNDVLDETQYVDCAYIFEVSSPGLTRPLKKEKDYIRNKGKAIDVKLYKKLNGSNEFTAILKDYEGGSFTFAPMEQADGEEIKIDKSEIARISLAFI